MNEDQTITHNTTARKSGTSTSIAISPPLSPSTSNETDHLLSSNREEGYPTLYDNNSSSDDKEEYNATQEEKEKKHLMTCPSSFCSLRTTISFVIVAIIVTNLVISSEISQSVEKGDFNKPYFIVYFNTSWLGLCLPLQIFFFFAHHLFKFIKEKLQLRRENQQNSLSINTPTTLTHYNNNEIDEYNDQEDDDARVKNQNVDDSKELDNDVDQILLESQQQKIHGNTLKRLFKEFCDEVENASPDKHHKIYDLILCALPLSMLWFFCNYIWFHALPLISVGSSTALYQSATIFVFIFSVFVLQEPLSMLKAISVLICVGGVVMISFSDEDDDKEYPYAIYGDLLMLISAIMWALYEVLYKRILGDLKTAAVNFYLGFLGIWNFVILWPGLILLNITEWETFEWPHGMSLVFVLVNAIVSLFLNYFINWGIAYASPLFIRSGVMCSIPAALIYDMIFNGKQANFNRMFGAALIIFGFAAVSLELPQNRLPKFLQRRTFSWGKITYGLI